MIGQHVLYRPTRSLPDVRQQYNPASTDEDRRQQPLIRIDVRNCSEGNKPDKDIEAPGLPPRRSEQETLIPMSQREVFISNRQIVDLARLKDLVFSSHSSS